MLREPPPRPRSGRRNRVGRVGLGPEEEVAALRRGLVGKEAAWAVTLSPPPQSEVMRLNDPTETLRV